LINIALIFINNKILKILNYYNLENIIIFLTKYMMESPVAIIVA